MSDPLGPVVITAREIYDQLVRLATAVEGLVKDHGDVDRQLADHETRIRNLESGRWPIPAVTIVIALAALAVAIVPLLNR